MSAAVSWVVLTHRARGNYRLHCTVCGRNFGDFTRAVPAWHLFRVMEGHNKFYGHPEALVEVNSPAGVLR